MAAVGGPVAAFLKSAGREVAFLRSSPWDLALSTWIPWLLMAIVAWQLSAASPRGLPIALVDTDQSIVGRLIAAKLEAAPNLRIASRPASLPEAFSEVRSRRVYAVVFVPHDATRDVMKGGVATLLGYFNASFSAGGAATSRDIAAAVQAANAELLAREVALIRGPSTVRPPPVRVQSSVLYKPQGSYEILLVSLAHPALLHLILCVCVISALARELRDRTAGDWIAACDGHVAAAIAGKLSLYVLAFAAYGVMALLYLSKARGWPVAGSAGLLIAGHLLLSLTYAAAGLLFIGATRTMSQALSIAGLYAGAAFAFTGAIFPLTDAPPLARVFSALLPFSAFARLQIEQLTMGAPIWTSMRQVGVLVLFLTVFLAIGLPLYRAALRAPDSWGRR